RQQDRREQGQQREQNQDRKGGVVCTQVESRGEACRLWSGRGCRAGRRPDAPQERTSQHGAACEQGVKWPLHWWRYAANAPFATESVTGGSWLSSPPSRRSSREMEVGVAPNKYLRSSNSMITTERFSPSARLSATRRERTLRCKRNELTKPFSPALQ